MRFPIIALIVIGMLSISTPTTAQVSGASVSLACEQNETFVLDGRIYTQSTFICVVSNPTAYEETIRIETDGPEGLSIQHPANITVSPGQNQQFSVQVETENQFNGWLFNVSIEASVVELNNQPPPNSAVAQQELSYRGFTLGCTGSDTARWIDSIDLEMAGGLGNLTIVLNHTAAPIHACNFALHSMMGNYDNTIFHRVIDDFMIQGGDFTNGDGTGGHAAKWFGYCNGNSATEAECDETLYTIPDEANNGLEHRLCTVSMAKTSARNTGGSQFFLMPDDISHHDWLDGVHTVFGVVTSGCDIITTISEIETGSGDKPVTDVVILHATPSYVLRTGDYDGDYDGDLSNHSVDNCPYVFNTNQSDLDGDAIGDACDDDMDGDGVDNNNDAFPYDANETTDTDGDGTGDNADADDDNDGMNDTSDAFPNDPNETTDTDGDGIGDNGDADDDGDGVADTTDNCPYTANPDQADADNDGIGTVCDGSEGETETPAVPALGFMATMLAVCIAVGLRKFD